MTPEQQDHLLQNTTHFISAYDDKYIAGQKEHGGNMWEMGAYQALKNRIEEDLDGWSYDRQIGLCLDQINDACDEALDAGTQLYALEAVQKIKEILNRVKED